MTKSYEKKLLASLETNTKYLCEHAKQLLASLDEWLGTKELSSQELEVRNIALKIIETAHVLNHQFVNEALSNASPKHERLLNNTF